VAEAVFANAEAVRHHRRALELVAALPSGRDRDAKELEALESMIPSLTAARGYSSPEVAEALDRTAALAEQLGRRRTLVSALVALCLTHFVRGHMAVALDLGARSLDLARHGGDADLVAQASFAYATAAASMGMPATAVEHFALASELAPDGSSTMLGTSLAVHSRSWSAHAQWLLGRDEQAGAEAATALDIARAIEHPWSLAVALSYAAVTAQLRDQRAPLPALTTELRALCERYDFPYYLEWADVLAGWTADDEPGLAAIRGGIGRLRAQGAFARMPYWLSLEADLLARLGRDDDARAVLDGARAGALQRDDRWWLPEVLRRRAALEPGPAGVRMLEQAAGLAVHQESPGLEARARADLAARRSSPRPDPNAGRTVPA
jgi:hypothetical protein